MGYIMSKFDVHKTSVKSFVDDETYLTAVIPDNIKSTKGTSTVKGEVRSGYWLSVDLGDSVENIFDDVTTKFDSLDADVQKSHGLKNFFIRDYQDEARNKMLASCGLGPKPNENKKQADAVLGTLKSLGMSNDDIRDLSLLPADEFKIRMKELLS